MQEFYTVSRRDISSLKELTLYPHDYKPYYTLEKFYESEEVVDLLKDLYPNGLSSHGLQYLSDRFYWTRDGDGTNYITYTPVLEEMFELVRLWKFNNLPSRFTSTFGCISLDDAKHFRDEYCRGAGNIYLVSVNDFFKGDMKWFYSPSIVGNIILAQKYWSGKATDNPFWEYLLSPPVTILSKIE